MTTELELLTGKEAETATTASNPTPRAQLNITMLASALIKRVDETPTDDKRSRD